MADLKPCPFCGGEAEMDYYQSFRHYRTGQPLDQPAVFCRDCSAEIAHYPGDLSLSREETAEIVVAAWNTRASDRLAFLAEIVAELEALAAWNERHDDGLSGLDKMAQGQREAIEEIRAKFGGGNHE